jgi:hypothetical protein
MPDLQQQDDQIKAMAPDNSVHRFPKGTDPAVIDRVMKQYILSKKAAPVAPQPAPQQSPQPTPPKTQEPWYQRGPRAFLKAAGLPETLGDVGKGVGDFGHWLLHGDVWAPVKDAVKNPSAESITRAVPLIGPASADAAEHVRNKDYVSAVGSLAGAVAPFAAARAMTVNGGIKAADAAAKAAKMDSREAVQAAHRVTSHPIMNAVLNQRAVEDAWIDTKFLDIAKKANNAIKDAKDEVKLHSDYLAKKIGNQGDINAVDEVVKVMKNFQDTVLTPETAHPVLRQMVEDAQAVAPEQWSWEKARQFRSSIGRAIGKVAGPQKAVLGGAYASLTDKLSSVTKKFGLEDSWNHYNELEKKLNNTFSDLIETAATTQRGAEMAQALSKDTSFTGRFLESLEQYGLDSKDVLKAVKTASKINKLRGKSLDSIFRWAYGNRYGGFTTVGTKLAGGSYAGALGLGALVGIGSTYFTRLTRALRLAPEVLEHILDEEKWPGKMPLPEGNFPEGELAAPEGKGPSGQPRPSQRGPVPSGTHLLTQQPPQLPGMPPPQLPPSRPARLPAPLSQQADAPGGESELERLRRNPSMPIQEMSEAEKKAAEVKSTGGTPTVTKAAPGEVGREPGARPGTTRESRIGRNTKQAERVANKRAQTLRGKQAEEAEATARAQAKDVNVSQMQIPEMEEALLKINPKALSGLQKLRKVGRVSDVEYTEALKYLIIDGYEKGSQK